MEEPPHFSSPENYKNNGKYYYYLSEIIINYNNNLILETIFCIGKFYWELNKMN